MLKSLALATVGSAALLVAGVAVAAPMAEGPEPYAAPVPSYTPHKIQSSVTYNQNGKLAEAGSTSDSGAAAR